MNKINNEEDILKELNITDFKNIKNEEIINFASMLEYMDPKLAQKVIESFPEVAKRSLEKIVDANRESSNDYYKVNNKVLSMLETNASRNDSTFEERKYCVEKGMEIARMAEKKDSENKLFYLKIISYISYLTLPFLLLIAILKNLRGKDKKIKRNL